MEDQLRKPVTKVVSSSYSFDAFDVAHPSEWPNYLQRLRFYFEANSTEVEKQRAVFFTVVGPEVFNLTTSLVSPKTVSDVPINEIFELLSNYFNPELNEIVETFKFGSRSQLEGESVASYAAVLRSLAARCNFGNFLERMLRDRLVQGVRDKGLQKLLLSKTRLTLKEAMELALAYETAERHVSELKEEKEVFSVKMSNKKEDRVPSQSMKECFRCGEKHAPNSCKFRWSTCRFCKKTGHSMNACFKKRNVDSRFKRDVDFIGETNNLEDKFLYNVRPRDSGCPAFKVEVKLDGFPLEMEIDTGAGVSIIGKETSDLVFGKNNMLNATDIKLRTWSSQPLQVLGKKRVSVKYEDRVLKLILYVIEGQGPSLLGRDWIQALGITLEPWNKRISCIKMTELERCSAFSTQSLGSYTGPPVCLALDSTVSPRYCKARPVPFALKEKVEAEIDRLENLGVLEPVAFTKWATPVVTVLKRNGEIRLCGDYKATINLALKPDKYPLPSTNEIFAILAGCTIFSKLDLDQAYTQVSVDDASSELLTINTSKGLYKVHRLPFGISAAPGIFQRLMDSLLKGIKGVAVLIDDIIIAGRNMEEHDKRLYEVIDRLSKAGFKAKREKCQFRVSSMVFLGFRVDAAGIHPTEDKVEAIHSAPEPRNKSELQAFLGLLNFYERFIRNKASILEPLHRLLDKEKKWEWSTEHRAAMQAAKEMLTTEQVLTHYDRNKKLVLACDASPYGVGAVLSHILKDGSEAPIAFGSRTLSSSERNYSQLDKEALAIMFGVRKFHQYVWGSNFTIVTDHKPLLGIFTVHKQTPAVLSPRLLRWSLTLGAYEYDLVFRPGKLHANADALSRLPKKVAEGEESEPRGIFLMEENSEIPLKFKDVVEATSKDSILLEVTKKLKLGWDEQNKEQETKELQGFYNRRFELSLFQGCVLLGDRVVIPSELRKKVLQMLHNSHRGIVITKALARSYVWWPGLDKDIEECVKTCEACQRNAHHPPKEDLRWPPATEPWSRLHIDFFGPIKGYMFFIVVDAYSKWPEVKPMLNITSNKVIDELRSILATHGIPHIVVSDNGPSFVSKDFKQFLENNGIKHCTSAPHHPSSNGQAERFVQTVKDLLKKIPEGPLQKKIAKLLYSLRTTPSSVTGKTPAELLMGRKIRTKLDLLHPRFHADFEDNMTSVKRLFTKGDKVWVRSFTKRGEKWIAARIEERRGAATYLVVDCYGMFFRRHTDQIRRRITSEDSSNKLDQNSQVSTSSFPSSTGTSAIEDEGERSDHSESESSSSTDLTEGRNSSLASHSPTDPGGIPTDSPTDPGGTSTHSPTDPGGTSTHRRSERARSSPRYLEDYVLNHFEETPPDLRRKGCCVHGFNHAL